MEGPDENGYRSPSSVQCTATSAADAPSNHMHMFMSVLLRVIQAQITILRNTNKIVRQLV